MIRKLLPILIFATIILLDQWLKLWVKTHMMLEQEFPVVGNWLYFHFTENKGMAFGIEFAGVWGKYLLSGIRIIAIIGLTWLIIKLVKKRASVGLIVGISLVATGAFGNIIDSAFYGLIFTDSFGQIAQFVPWGEGYAPFLQGKVVDMFYFQVANFHLPEWFPFWPMRHVLLFRPVFNVADFSITFGILYLLLFRRKALRKALSL
jgi:signal peptidase II